MTRQPKDEQYYRELIEKSEQRISVLRSEMEALLTNPPVERYAWLRLTVDAEENNIAHCRDMINSIPKYRFPSNNNMLCDGD